MRAVLTLEEAESLLKEHSAHFAGQFPTPDGDSSADFAVLQILEEKTNGEWRNGFYRFADNIMQIEESVQSCNTALAQVLK